MSLTAEILRKNVEVMNISVNLIRTNPYQPRKVFDRELLVELADSIRQYGVLQPISVRRSGDRFELVAGERRLRASKLAGRDTIPAIVIEISDRDSAFIALMENLQRENLNFLEEAEGYVNLIQDYGMTQEEVAQRLGKSQSSVANKIRVLRLPDDIKAKINENGLTERHARALLRISDEKLRKNALETIIANKLNVKNADDYIDELLRRTGAKKSGKSTKTDNKLNNLKLYIKDARIYVNTVKRAVSMINDMGGSAVYEIIEGDEAVQIVVRIKNKRQ